MGNLLYTIAVILIILWAIGFLGYHAGGIIHILLVIAVIAVLIRVIQGKKVWNIYCNLLVFQILIHAHTGVFNKLCQLII